MTVSALIADTHATEDLLGFTPHAQRLAATILGLPKDHSFVIGIEGEWGEGKSSFIHFFKNRLNAPEAGEVQPAIVEFNPWWYEGSDKLLSHLLETLIHQLNAMEALDKEFKQTLIQFFKALDGAAPVIEKSSKAWLPLLGVVATGAAAAQYQWLGAVLGVLVSVLAKLGLDYAQKTPSLEELRGKLVTNPGYLTHANQKVVVIIDDLDRLPRDEIQQLFRVIKGVLNLPNIVYVIAYDRKIVASALSDFHKDSGEAYLEKIIQLPYRLPKPRQQIRAEYNVKLLSSLAFLNDLAVANQALHHINDAFLPMPRDVKRLHACLLINQHIPNEIRMEPLDFVFLEALRLKSRMLWQETIRALLNCRELEGFSSVKNQSGKNQAVSNRSRDDWFQRAFERSIAEIFNNEKPVWDCLEFFTGFSDDARYRPHRMPEKVTRLNQAGRQWSTADQSRWRDVTALVWRYMRAGLNDLDIGNDAIAVFMSCADDERLAVLLLQQDAFGFRLKESVLLKEASQWLLRQNQAELKQNVAKHAHAIALVLDKCFVRDVSRDIDAADGDAELLLDYLVQLFIWLESLEENILGKDIVAIPHDWLRDAPGTVLELMCMNRPVSSHFAKHSEDICQYFVERHFAELRQLHALFGLLNLMGKMTGPAQNAWLSCVPEFERLSPEESQAWRTALSRWGNAKRHHLDLKWLENTSFSRFVQAARSSCIGSDERVPFDSLLAAFGVTEPTDIASPV